AIDAIAQVGRRWAILEDVTEMAAAAAAVHLGAHHPVAAVARAFDPSLDWIIVARPARAALGFGLGYEQRLTASDSAGRAWTLLVIERAAAGTFGPVTAHDVVLLAREQAPPFLVGVGDRVFFLLHAASLSRCQMSDVRCQMSDVRCQMSDVR